MTSAELPVALTIAGSDSGGGAGIQADLLTFAAHRVFGTTAITCLTAQNPDGVTAIETLPASFVLEQILQVHRCFSLRALKTGMAPTPRPSSLLWRTFCVPSPGSRRSSIP